MGRYALPAHSYNAMDQAIHQRRVCSDCSTSTPDPDFVSKTCTEEPVENSLSLAFLHPFQWLIRTCATDTSRLALLKGLYRVFCHLDLHGKDLRSLEFGKFMLAQLDDQNKHIRKASG
jgi:hypothetical protein